MPEPHVAPYGFWKSPITSDLITSHVIGLGAVRLDGEDVYWSELRPAEGGRIVVVRQAPDGRQVVDVTPPGFNVRTRVHEYGGGSYLVDRGVVYFSNWEDQRLYRQAPDAEPEPITPVAALRYADGVVDPLRNRLICVREDHRTAGREAVSTLAAVELDGSGNQDVLVSGEDFYASPRLSPSGDRLAWLCWNHPNMPWDGCELRVAEVLPDGALGPAELVAGGPGESVYQPEWSPDGVLHFVSDRTGWWNLYRCQDGKTEPLAPMDAEFGEPQWVFGMRTYAFESADRIVCAYSRRGDWSLAVLETRTLALRTLALPYTVLDGVQARPGAAYFVAASPSESPAIVRLDLAGERREALRRSTPSRPELEPYLSVPELVEFPTEDGLTAFGLFYRPCNPDFRAPEGARPPLIVMSHGGPTSSTSSSLSLGKQYWTSRGIAVLDVDYGGSSGYGRAYRERLEGRWGIVDVDDCVNGARWLAERGEVDGSRMAITGGSAGGYTTLCALTFRDVFTGGASHFGVSDLEALARDTHKFESRYLDRLIGPYPERRDLYLERSPIHFADRLSVPVAFFQGAEDAVVPPSQTERMVEALRAKDIPVMYLLFDGEQHGFRKGDNIKRALDGELYFYANLVFKTALRF